eukprot:TRINITY_DN2711_c0_g1_i2.p1 TRINITY_DN2711_c0_g1~~TRINITY_DN2711_c0_g1_i2.p1  ORF type:complete len:276 (+),score=11.73 TRINITY_DN2711_c0_g1_i2:140-967(+)
MTPRIYLHVLILLVLSRNVLSGLTFNQDSFPKPIFAPVLRFQGGLSTFPPITAPVVFEPDTTSAQTRLAGNGTIYKNSIVFANGTYWRSVYPWMVNMALPYGALAVVLENGDVDESLGTAEFTTAPWAINYSIPVVSISVVTLKAIYSAYHALNASAGVPLMATVTADGGLTPWRQVLFAPAFWFFSIFNAASSCFLAVFALLRMRQYYLAWGKLRASVPLAVLIFECLGGISMYRCAVFLIKTGAKDVVFPCVFRSSLHLLERGPNVEKLSNSS